MLGAQPLEVQYWHFRLNAVELLTLGFLQHRLLEVSGERLSLRLAVLGHFFWLWKFVGVRGVAD